MPFRGVTSWIAPPATVSPHSGMSSQGVGIPLQQTGPSVSCTPQQFPYSGLTQRRFTATGAPQQFPYSGLTQQRFTATGAPQQFPCSGLTQQRFTATGVRSEMSQQAQYGDGDAGGETSVAVKKQKMDPQYMTERKLWNIIVCMLPFSLHGLLVPLAP